MKTNEGNEAKTEPRKLETIQIERRFGGFLPVLKFCNGELENAGVHVHQTPGLALAKAEEWIAQPCHNIQWWR